MEDISLLTRLERLGIFPRPQRSPYDHIRFFLADLADILVLPGAADTAFFSLAPGVELDVDTAGQVEEIIQARGYRDRLKFLEYSQASENGLQILEEIPGLAFFSRSDIRQLKKTASLKSFLTNIVVNRTPLSAINPYTYQGPVTGSRFFGREEELRILRLQTGKSFVLSGVRRSGKTSLMMELTRQLRHSTTELTVFVNFEICQSFADVPYILLRQLAYQLRERSSALSERGDNLIRLANSRQWQHPRHLVHLESTIWNLISSREEARRVRFLFDEYDRVISLEERYDRVFTKIWRDLVMRVKTFERRANSSAFVQFIFAGSRRLYEEILSSSSPFFNIGAERLLLQNFDLNTLTALVTRPMRELGIEIQDAPRIAQVLLEQTGGHPATTQHLLSLVVADPLVGKARSVGFEDIFRAASRQEFLGMLRNTLNVNVSFLGRFILSQVAISRRERVSVDFIQGVGRRHLLHFDEAQLNVEFQDLADSGYLRALDFVGGQSHYRLAVPVVQRLFTSEDIPDLIRDMLAQGICTPLSRVN